MNTGIYNEKGDIDARRWQIFKSYVAQLAQLCWMKIIKMVIFEHGDMGMPPNWYTHTITHTDPQMFSDPQMFQCPT